MFVLCVNCQDVLGLLSFSFDFNGLVVHKTLLTNDIVNVAFLMQTSDLSVYFSPKQVFQTFDIISFGTPLSDAV